MPAPAPTPAPPTRLLYSAATDFAHWYTELVPNRFEVEIFAERVQFGSLDLPITTQERDAILCVVKGEMTVSLERYSGNTWVWTINGMAGQASGRMTQ